MVEIYERWFIGDGEDIWREGIYERWLYHRKSVHRMIVEGREVYRETMDRRGYMERCVHSRFPGLA